MDELELFTPSSVVPSILTRYGCIKWFLSTVKRSHISVGDMVNIDIQLEIILVWERVTGRFSFRFHDLINNS